MEPIRINIATFEYLDKKIVLIISVLVTCVAVMTAVNTSLYLSYRNQIGEFEKKTSRIEKSMEQNRSKTDISDEEWESLQHRVILANQIIVKDAVPWSRLFEVLETKVPSGMLIESVNLTNDYHTLILEGRVASERKITFFMERLKEVDFLSNSLLTEFSIGANDDGRFKKVGTNISFRVKSDLHIENLFEQKAYRQNIKETMALPQIKK